MTELGKEHDVRAFNFTRQYPDILFPGKTQFVTPDDEAVSVESTALLDTVNPITWKRCAEEIEKWQADVLVIRYWMSWFAPSLGYICRRLRKTCKVVAILDNVIPHERHFFDAPLTKYLLGGVDGCVTLCKEVASDLLKLKRNAVYTVLPHPAYNHFGEKLARLEAERILGLKSGMRNILFFGLIREYKGLDILLEAFDRLEGRSWQLIIAGEPYGSFEPYQKMIDSSPNRDRILCHTRYIKDSEVKNYFSAADVVVLPYRSATQSGISAIANHFEIPMIVTDVGGLRETIADTGMGLVCEDHTPMTIARNIERFFKDSSLQENCVKHIKAENERLSWPRFCRDLTSFIEKDL